MWLTLLVNPYGLASLDSHACLTPIFGFKY